MLSAKFYYTELGPEDHVFLYSVSIAQDGGILDWDDLVSDVLDDRELLIANFSFGSATRANNLPPFVHSPPPAYSANLHVNQARNGTTTETVIDTDNGPSKERHEIVASGQCSENVGIFQSQDRGSVQSIMQPLVFGLASGLENQTASSRSVQLEDGPDPSSWPIEGAAVLVASTGNDASKIVSRNIFNSLQEESRCSGRPYTSLICNLSGANQVIDLSSLYPESANLCSKADLGSANINTITPTSSNNATFQSHGKDEPSHSALIDQEVIKGQMTGDARLQVVS
ncbi:unnamed protein product, partial [Protopolystoma xenopodis]